MNCAFVTRVAMFAAVCLIVSFETAFSRNRPDSIITANLNNIIVLTPDDPEPAEAKKLTTVNINGNNPSSDCSYFEILRSVKELAQKNNANIIKVTRHYARDNKRDCDEVSAVLYRSVNATKYATELEWDGLKRLCWEDFKGGIPADATSNTAAATYCGIGFETNTVTNDDKVKVHVYNTFYANKSWVRADGRTNSILAHEQGHFDLCELYTRKFREKVDNAVINSNNLKHLLPRLYNEVNLAYEKCQNEYEMETQHGIDNDRQLNWINKISLELKATEKWASK